ncbi:MAG TPA: VOC family protein [Caulobacteraceae bacterium]|jgi:catechol 2,3-dioxygenase-like lactoylglutathione lyase family enzyme|nr:VOC family protein [Caulobacteraceae bacterium]
MSGEHFDVYDLEHVQLAMPAGAETAARGFYRDALGLAEVAKPADLAMRGGCWFEAGALRLHLGVDARFQAARKAHPALLVHNLPALRRRLEAAGFPPREDEPLDGYDRCYVDDPFGNRIELMEPLRDTV